MSKKLTLTETINAWRKVIREADDEDTQIKDKKKFKNYAEEKHYYEEVAPENEFIKWYQKQDQPNYDKPSVTADFVGLRFNKHKQTLQVLLVQRKRNPYRNSWALPGGFVKKNESIEDALIREVHEETSLNIKHEQTQLLPAISTPGRDPRMWIITNPSIVLLSWEDSVNIKYGDDAENVKWFDVKLDRNQQVIIEPQLAFDHIDIIKSALQSLQRTWNLKLYDGLHILLGNKFTIKNFKNCLGSVINKFLTLDNSNIKRLTTRNILQALDEHVAVPQPGRRSELYTWK